MAWTNLNVPRPITAQDHITYNLIRALWVYYFDKSGFEAEFSARVYVDNALGFVSGKYKA